MNQKEIRELIDFLVEKDIAEFELERGDVKLRVKRGGEVHVTTAMPSVPAIAPIPVVAPMIAAAAQAAPAAVPAAAAQPAAAAEEELHMVKSPIVGTFYESPAPGAPPFVKPGDTVQAGQVLCIIEAMKLMNEIEADISGEVVKLIAVNGQPVEYGQPLFAIRPKK
jgi:acetyl-CoA carboxylase biotin carboxyl carrier protein